MISQMVSVWQRQLPLRRLYKECPSKAMITKQVHVNALDLRDPLHCTVVPDNVAHPKTPYGVAWDLGIDEAVGGFHDAPNPAEMLCGALAACLGSTVRMVANVLQIGLEELDVEVVGQVDVRGALAMDPSVPVGFQTMTSTVRICAVAGTPTRLVEQLCDASERLCIDLQTLRNGLDVEVAFDTGPSTTAQSQ
jgi:uncharacterized OsmC-like protein